MQDPRGPQAGRGAATSTVAMAPQREQVGLPCSGDESTVVLGGTQADTSRAQLSACEESLVVLGKSQRKDVLYEQ